MNSFRMCSLIFSALFSLLYTYRVLIGPKNVYGATILTSLKRRRSFPLSPSALVRLSNCFRLFRREITHEPLERERARSSLARASRESSATAERSLFQRYPKRKEHPPRVKKHGQIALPTNAVTA